MFQNEQPEKRKQQTTPIPISNAGIDDCLPLGYSRVIDNIHIQTCINYIANVISSSNLMLLENGDTGDKRVYNELINLIDRQPTPYLTKQVWLSNIVRNMVSYGNAIIKPSFINKKQPYSQVLLEGLYPLDMGYITLTHDTTDKIIKNYIIRYKGLEYKDKDVLNFTYNVDTERPYIGKGIQLTARDLIRNITQLNKTKNKILSTEGRPQLLLFYDGLWKSLGRLDDEQITDEDQKYIDWQTKRMKQGLDNGLVVMPGDSTLEIRELKPLSLKDLAIAENLELDLKTCAKLLGVPLFAVGLADFNKDEYDNFINTIIKPIIRCIEQELTAKLILNPKWYIKFNIRSLNNYTSTEALKIIDTMFTKGLMTGNEAREFMGMGRLEGLDELIILENFVPIDRLGDQKKLNSEGEG